MRRHRRHCTRLLAVAALLALGACTTQTPSAAKPPTFADLRPSSVSLLSAQEGWVVSGAISSASNTPPAYELQLTQGHWTRVPLDDSADLLYKAVMLAPTDVWAVGEKGVYHFDGVLWTRTYASPQTATSGLGLQDMAFVSPTEGWAVGVGGVLHYHDGDWTDVTATLPHAPPTSPGALPPGPGLHGVALVSSTEGWAVGDAGAIWRFDGATWRPVAAPSVLLHAPFGALDAVALTAPGEGWAVGGVRTEVSSDDCVSEPSVLEQLSSGHWTVATTLLPGVNGAGQPALHGAPGQPELRTLAMTAPAAGWAAGGLLYRWIGNSEAASHVCTTTSYVMHLSGGQWTPVLVPDVGAINGLAFDSPNDGWAAADGGLLHYHDGTWTAVRM